MDGLELGLVLGKLDGMLLGKTLGSKEGPELVEGAKLGILLGWLLEDGL